MPKPKPREDYHSYITRAVRYMITVEGLKPDHARAKAEGMWRQHLKKSKK